MVIRPALLVLLAALCALPAGAQTRRELRDARRSAESQEAAAEAAARATEAARAEETRLAEQRVVAARAVQAAEARLNQAEGAARRAAQDAAGAMQDRQARAAAIAPLLPLLYRLERWPAESLLATPAAPEESLRGLLAMQVLIRQAGQEAEAFRLAAARATETARLAAREADRLSEARAEARAADARLEAALDAARGRRANREAQQTQAARRAQAAIGRARDLEQALERLERERAAEEARQAARQRAAEEAARRARRPPPVAEAPVTPSRGGHPLPVPGQITREFGSSGEGGTARGMTVAAGPRARVVSPCGGRVAFAGPFRSFGQLIIIDCGGGVHVVLARLERLDTAMGERVLAGEPVGSLSSDAQLYVELRRNGQPSDPRGFFRG
ncbi:hypothetical protein EOD42_09495 [Rhodovarius crocodyli]|uniref:M23ase beta-sheet core domain-containing protein n=1 Tax=Rhodovarius crocodyli TaxID=1979269 RepID=A0A437MG57_9PROT|nr:peptidoglycan DD-metalloendopeptidase family protein [Rhodovarius crocodyli]RVT96643.1 hypothetical protein EOD42_09495 [Rhodovarius crocodyli]